MRIPPSGLGMDAVGLCAVALDSHPCLCAKLAPRVASNGALAKRLVRWMFSSFLGSPPWLPPTEGEDLRPLKPKPAGRWTRQLPLFASERPIYSAVACSSVSGSPRHGLPCRAAWLLGRRDLAGWPEYTTSEFQ
jgi:hypothetical protein